MCGFGDFLGIFILLLYSLFVLVITVMTWVVLENSNYFLDRWSVSYKKQVVLTLGTAPDDRFLMFHLQTSIYSTKAYQIFLTTISSQLPLKHFYLMIGNDFPIISISKYLAFRFLLACTKLTWCWSTKQVIHIIS